MTHIPLSVAIPTYRNGERLLATLREIDKCVPAPAEILVYIDNSDHETHVLLKKDRPFVKVLLGHEHLGPGGGRNLLLDVASSEIVVSFDDDSYPMDADFFAQAMRLAARFPEAGIIGARVFHPEEAAEPLADVHEWGSEFVGCAAIYRREAFLEAGGYVALPVAYGMEESDLSLRLIAKGWGVLRTHELRVYHATDRSHQRRPVVVAGNLANLALLGFLRYPLSMIWITPIQVLHKIFWYICHGRYRGLGRSPLVALRTMWHHRHDRVPVSRAALRRYFRLRRRPHAAV